MEVKFLFETEKGEYKVPLSKELYMKNLEYFEGMGMYPQEICQEKALQITGYRVVKPHEFEEINF